MPAYKYKISTGKTLWYASFRYTDWTGEQKRKVKRGFETRREALEYERTFMDKQGKDPTILYSSLVSNYLEDLKSRLKPTTLRNKKSMFENHILPYLGKNRICDITPKVVRDWQNSLIKTELYSDTYLRTLNAQLSASLNYAVMLYQLRNNPCNLTPLMGKANADEMNIWTLDEFEHFIQFEQKTTYKVAFDVLFYTGIREGELLGLTPQAIKDEDVLHIYQNFQIVDGEELLMTPKTEGSKRDVTIPHTVYAELKDYADKMPLDPDDRIFFFQKGALVREFHRITKKAGLPEIRIHDLRHSHATMLIQMGTPIIEVSHRLGHAKPSTTLNIYAHVYSEMQGKIADQLDKKKKGVSKADSEGSDPGPGKG